MSPIEIRLEPAMVSALMESIDPVLQELDTTLASNVELPSSDEPDELLEDFWTSDLLESQRSEVAVLRGLFGERFMETGSALITEDEMVPLLRACSAVRLKLRDGVLSPLGDEQLETGELEEIEWTEEMRMGYAGYALFASMQEIIVSQINGDGPMGHGQDEPEEDENGFTWGDEGQV